LAVAEPDCYSCDQWILSYFLINHTKLTVFGNVAICGIPFAFIGDLTQGVNFNVHGIVAMKLQVRQPLSPSAKLIRQRSETIRACWPKDERQRRALFGSWMSGKLFKLAMGHAPSIQNR